MFWWHTNTLVLCICRRKGNGALFCARPKNRTRAKMKEPDVDLQSSRSPAQLESILPTRFALPSEEYCIFHVCPSKVAKNFPCSFSVKLMWFLHELGNQPNCIGDIGTTRSLVQKATNQLLRQRNINQRSGTLGWNLLTPDKNVMGANS